VTNLRPLLETSPNPRTRILLRAGLTDRPSAHSAKRVAAALGLSIGLSTKVAGGAALASAGSASALGPAVIVKLFTVGALSGLVVAGGSVAVRHGLGGSESAHESENGVDSAMQSPMVSGNASGLGAQTPPAGGTVPSGAVPNANQGSPSTPSSRGPSGTTSEDPASEAAEREGALSRELAPIDRARAALAAGAPEQTLSELSEYEKVRSTGTLDREAWVLRVEAFVRLGKRSEARELATRYLERFPKDAHATRLREIADGR
jgi:hypothetical protein